MNKQQLFPYCGYIGQWVFEGNDSGFPTELELSKGISKTSAILQQLTLLLTILEKQELLVANKCMVEFYDQNEMPYQQTKQGFDYRQEIDINADSPQKKAQFILNTIREIEQNEHVYAVDITSILGVGFVFTENDKLENNYLFVIDGFRFFEPRFVLRTHTDSWLPLSLSGIWQIPYYQCNYYRLEQLFNSIQQELNLELDLDEDCIEWSEAGCIQQGAKLYNAPRVILAQDLPSTPFNINEYLLPLKGKVEF